ncbi:MAG: DNA polymerase III subunit gamma/tau [Bacteroidetes bacterium]|nr:DNA polymerase III subunit gamma/tau [Bacteroidota bacterium]
MSNFIVSARKYRPVRFSEVVGQEHVSQTLKNALQNDHLAHAFLFCGPRGVGKTTCARILAKVLNCQNLTEDHEPCNTCSSCEAFNQNASFNITELDAASNNSVEHIRALIEQVRFQPQQGKYKVFIIDEVHMLSQQAFNAFLKTLEEPPSYAIFILATTEKHKIIPTILSRCQIFDFKRIQVPQMVAHLEGICAEENINAEKEALHVIAQKADGALRDALSIFDRVVSFSGKALTYADVIENLNVLDYDYFFRATDFLLSEDHSGLMLLFDEVIAKGFEGDVFINGLAAHFRNLLVCKDPATWPLLEAGEKLKQRYKSQAAMAPESLLLSALDLANHCDINYRMARNKRLHVEMSLMKMAFLPKAIRVSLGTAPAPEKKTADQSVTQQNPTPKPENKTEEKQIPEAEDLPVSDQTPQQVEEPKQEVQSKAAAPNPVKNKSKRFSTPKIDLTSIESDVKKDNGADVRSHADLKLEEVQTAWQAFAEKVESDSLKTVMQGTELDVEDGKMIVIVGRKFSENQIRQADGMMDFLREELKLPTLIREFRIDKSLAPEVEAPKPKKLLNDKEKLKLMKEQNPLLSEFGKRFDLQRDGE